MTIKQIAFSGFNKEHQNVGFFIDIKDNTYIFNVKWSAYCDCAFLSITDYEDNPIISGVALVNGLKIRTNKLPYVFYFVQINGETYEPELNTLENEFVFLYDDEATE